MEISKELADMINDQLNFEIYSGYIYLAMGAWFEDQNLSGFARWMEIQFDEEYAHAIRFWRHLYERGAKVELKAIEAPKTEWTSPLEAFQDAYEHEKLVTERIYKIGELAEQQKDRATLSFLNWFYDEQVEEEDKTMTIRDTLKMIGDSIPALLQLDAKLGARPPVSGVPQESTEP
ncbi:MAG: ferritin [Candidatus Lokiarchaeota archaeon]|nr:ferritin [Candidatus Lokiarchaeota archaeon]